MKVTLSILSLTFVLGLFTFTLSSTDSRTRRIQTTLAESIYFNKTIGAECDNNLECNSACCHLGECSETDDCKNLVKWLYIGDAIVCFILIVGFLVYLCCRLQKIKEQFNNENKDKEKNEGQNEEAKNVQVMDSNEAQKEADKSKKE